MDFKDRLLKWYDEKGKNLDEHYNPWEEGEIGGEKINEFVAALKDDSLDFCWVDGKKAASKYIVPYVLQGDYKNANLYQCLYNPGVSDDVWNIDVDNFKGFRDEINNIEDTKVEYIQNMYNEVDFDKIYKIIISSDNMLYLELQEINKQRSTFKNSEERLKQFINEHCYYIKTYYKGVLAHDYDTSLIGGCVKHLYELLQDDTDKFDDYLKQVKDFKICNLELVPFPTNKKSDISYKEVEKKYTEFVVAIILSRIAKFYFYKEYEKGELTFVFRSKQEWKDVLIDFIKEHILKEKSEKDIRFEFENSFIKQHFFEFSNQNACISPNTITKEISKDDFENRITKYFQ